MLDNLRQQSAQRIKEIDQLMAQVEEANQAANENIRKLQVEVDKLPEDNPNKNKLTEFCKLLAEQEEATKTGKPLTLIKERDEFLRNHAVRQTSQADNNSCKVTAEQMIARFIKQDSALPKEKVLANSKNCPVPTNTAMILQPLMMPPKVKTSKTQINNR